MINELVVTFLNIPILNIKKRYIGCETYCETTAAYNTAMHKILPQHNIEVVECERISANKEFCEKDYISASKIREAIKQDELNDVLSSLPESTKNFLLSDDSAEIRLKIKKGNSRH